VAVFVVIVPCGAFRGGASLTLAGHQGRGHRVHHHAHLGAASIDLAAIHAHINISLPSFGQTLLRTCAMIRGMPEVAVTGVLQIGLVRHQRINNDLIVLVVNLATLADGLSATIHVKC